MEATLISACPQLEIASASHIRLGTQPRRVVKTLGRALVIAAVGAAVVMGEAAVAGADGLTVQSGSSVDTDGTQGDWTPASTSAHGHEKVPICGQ